MSMDGLRHNAMFDAGASVEQWAADADSALAALLPKVKFARGLKGQPLMVHLSQGTPDADCWVWKVPQFK